MIYANILIKEPFCGNLTNALRLFFGNRKELIDMGKDLKGKVLGPGVMQRKDGRYSGRYTGADGKRHEKYFDNTLI